MPPTLEQLFGLIALVLLVIYRKNLVKAPMKIGKPLFFILVIAFTAVFVAIFGWGGV